MEFDIAKSPIILNFLRLRRPRKSVMSTEIFKYQGEALWHWIGYVNKNPMHTYYHYYMTSTQI